MPKTKYSRAQVIVPMALAFIIFVYLGYAKLAAPKSVVEDFRQTKTVLDSDYKVYDNFKFGYQARYVSDWVIEYNGDTVTFSNPEDFSEEINVTVTDAKNFETVKQAFKAFREIPATVGGERGLKMVSEEEDNLSAVLVVNERKLFYISGSTPVFDEFVATFKFLE